MAEQQTISTPQPADAVTFTILSEGEAIPSTIDVQSISVWHELNRISSARLVILDGSPANQNFEISEMDLFIPGKKIEILAGYHSDEEKIFSGMVLKHSIKIRENGSSQLIIDCRHTAVKLTHKVKSKYFYNKAESDVWKELMDQHNITNEVSSTGNVIQQLLQYQSSDWDFIATRAELNGMFITTNNNKVLIAPPNFDQEPTETVNFGSTILAFDAEIDASSQFTEVTGRTWDYSKTEMTEVNASTSNPKTPGNIEYEELAKVLGDEPVIFKNSAKQPDEILQKWADATLMRHQLAKVRGRAKFQGIAGVEPGKIIQLQGLGDRFNGKAFVSGVQHDIRRGNWYANVQFGIDPDSFAKRFEISEKPAAQMIPAVNGLQLGTVTQLEGDPEGDDRILINLPMVDAGGDGVWTRMATYGAGDSRGIIIRPEIGDEVVVGFTNDDPNQPVLLGALNSNNLPAPIEPSDDNYEKGWVTKSGIKAIINDDKVSLNVELPSGKKLFIDEDSDLIEFGDEHGNKITMDQNGISIESGGTINLKANSGDINMEAVNWNSDIQASTKLNASGAAEFSSSGSTVIKGSIIQIN